ncbi:MAG: hypothetical protein ACR2PR_09140 [Pseudohongiellaceae bacterium]
MHAAFFQCDKFHLDAPALIFRAGDAHIVFRERRRVYGFLVSRHLIVSGSAWIDSAVLNVGGRHYEVVADTGKRAIKIKSPDGGVRFDRISKNGDECFVGSRDDKKITITKTIDTRIFLDVVIGGVKNEIIVVPDALLEFDGGTARVRYKDDKNGSCRLGLESDTLLISGEVSTQGRRAASKWAIKKIMQIV